MDNNTYSKDETHIKLVESLMIFSLLSSSISECILLLNKEENKVPERLAIKSLYIDIKSFNDELELFNNLLIKKGSFEELKFVTDFLLLTNQGYKLLNKHKSSIDSFRNTIYAHNYRANSKGTYIDPIMKILKAYENENSVILKSELIVLGEIVLLIISIALECFRYASDMVYIIFQNNLKLFNELFPLIEEGTITSFGYSIDKLRNEVLQIKDALISNQDNRIIIAERIIVRKDVKEFLEKQFANN